MLTVAEKNKNPGCVKQGLDPWKGSQTADASGHAVFDDPVYGFRALYRTLAQKYMAGKRDLLAIMRDYAPADDTQGSIAGRPANDPGSYAQYLSRVTGHAIGEDLLLVDAAGDPRSMDLMIALARGIEHYEAGREWATQAQRVGGLALYMQDFVRIG